MKKNCRKLLPIFLYKYFVGNIYEFYNFVKNNYPKRNYLSIKILRKNSGKKFLQFFLINL